MPVLLPEARDLLTAFAHIAIDDRLAEAATDAGLATVAPGTETA